MSKIKISFEIPSDSEGYVTFECPFCQAEFKLLANEIQDEEKLFDELFCPYCGLTDKVDYFYSKEVLEHMQNLALNEMVERLNKSIGKMAKSIDRNKYMKMDFKPLKKGNIRGLREQDTNEEIFRCKACEHHEKVIYCVGVSKVFCAYCGVDL